MGCSRQPGSQANKHGAGGVERILHGSCVRRSPERSISSAAGAKGEGKLRLIRRKGGRGEGICGRAKTFVNKLHCNVADERATPGERDPALRHKSGAAPAESRKSRWHKREENHPLLLPNNSPGPPNTIPPLPQRSSSLGWQHGRAPPGDRGESSPQTPFPAWVWEARVHPLSRSRSRSRGRRFHLQLLDFLCSFLTAGLSNERVRARGPLLSQEGKRRLSGKEMSSDTDRSSLTTR